MEKRLGKLLKDDGAGNKTVLQGIDLDGAKCATYVTHLLSELLGIPSGKLGLSGHAWLMPKRLEKMNARKVFQAAEVISSENKQVVSALLSAAMEEYKRLEGRGVRKEEIYKTLKSRKFDLRPYLPGNLKEKYSREKSIKGFLHPVFTEVKIPVGVAGGIETGDVLSFYYTGSDFQERALIDRRGAAILLIPISVCGGRQTAVVHL